MQKRFGWRCEKLSTKTYRVTLKTLGPVHIGTGSTLTKQEFILDKQNRLIHIINGRKLVNYLKQTDKLADYIDYFSEPEHHTNLGSFLQEQSILNEDWEQFIHYSIPIVYEEGQKVNVISPFMRDGLNKAYIPGSSLKGLLRTILVGEERNRETNIFFSHIRISDSEPVNDKQLVVYQKIDIGNKVKPIPQFRECIDANVSLSTYLTIEDDVITIEEIKEKIIQFYYNYRTKWLLGFKELEAGKPFFEQGDEATRILMKEDAQVIFIGGGVGVASKTVHYQKYDRQTAKKQLFELLQRRSRNIYGKFDIMPRNVPIALKLTKHHETNKWLLQGACEISFERL